MCECEHNGKRQACLGEPLLELALRVPERVELGGDLAHHSRALRQLCLRGGQLCAQLLELRARHLLLRGQLRLRPKEMFVRSIERLEHKCTLLQNRLILWKLPRVGLASILAQFPAHFVRV